MANRTRIYVLPSHTKKIFRNMKRTSVSTKTVADEAINEEMYDSLERATTTATGLDADQDRGNIAKTQSKATLNEPSSIGTSSGSGPRRQDTMGDAAAQTRSERVLNLETTKTSQAQEITSLKKKVKRLEKKTRSRTHGLKRLYKVGLSTRVESSADEESLSKEDASKQGRISDIDANQDIYVVNVHREEDIFGVNDQDDTSMFDADKDLQGKEVVVKEVNVASIATSVTATATTAVSFDELTLAQALVEIKLQNLRQRELLCKSQRRKFFAAKRAKEKRNKPPTKAQQRSIISTYLKNMDGWKPRDLKNKSFAEIKELFDKTMTRINNFVDFRTELVEMSTKKDKAKIAQKSSSKRAGNELDQERSKKQKIEYANESAELKRCLEIVSNDGDDVTIDATPLSFKSPTIVDYKIYKEGKKSYFQIFNADGNSHMYLTFSKTLKNFDREDLEVLWRLVKDRFVKTKPVDDIDSFLMHTLKTMFEHHVEDTVWKSQQRLTKGKS
nr:hypothetical protein [Tanacetum cinerariifolium]